MVILDFHIHAKTSSSYTLEIFTRGNSQPLASAQFDLPLSFLTGYELSGLEPDSKDPAARVERLKAFGGKLYQKLFASEDVRRVWEEHHSQAEFLTLCLRIAPDAVALEALPWEALYDGKEFIAAGVKTGVSRLPLDIVPSDDLPAVPLPVRMFALVASPLDLPEGSRLKIEREQEILLEAVNTPAGQGKLFVNFEDEAKLDIMENSLEAGYHIFHFTGHGIPPEAGGGLLLEDAAGKQRATSVSEMIAALQKGAATLRLVVLLGCQTARTLHTGGFSDLARGLARGLQGMPKIPAVLAMQFSITDTGGLMLAEKLYPRLLEGQPLEIALSRTRRDLLLSDDPYLQGDAIVPVLLVSNGRCLQSRTADLPDAPQLIEPDFSFHLPLAQHSFGFYGRRREYRQLRDGLLQRNQRAIIIHGIGGIGKTALVSQAATRLRKRFRGVYAFDCGGGTLAPERVIAELHRYFELQGIHTLQRLAFQPLPPGVLANYLAQVLAQWPLLLIFDNFETQLEREGDDFRIADEALRTFLTTLVKATATGSRFLFTSRYLFDVDDKRLGNIQSLLLGDLSRSEALMMMQRLPHLAAAAYGEKLSAYQTFGGHPYALVALDRHCNFRKLSDALTEARALHTELREFLAIEINHARLSDDARELLNRLAAFRQAVPFAAAEWIMKEASDLNRPIAELIKWGMLMQIQNNGQLESLAVHNLVRDFCRDHQASELWRNRLCDAATFYTNLTRTIPQDDKTKATVWNEMAAFDLLMEAEEFEDAAYILVNASKLLLRWGFGRYVEIQSRHLLGKVDNRTAAAVWHNYGIILRLRGEYAEALTKYKASLKIREELGDRAGVAASLLQIGAIHHVRGNYDLALDQYYLSLRTAQELGDRALMAGVLHNIGVVHQARGEYDKALEQYHLSLKINEELGNREDVAGLFHQIGMIHYELSEYDKALKEYQSSLEISEELGDRVGLASSIHDIGRVHEARGEFAKALEQYQLSLKIEEELENRGGIATSRLQIGIIHHLLGEQEKALDQYWISHGIFEDIADQEGIAVTLLEIGRVYQTQDEYEKALDQYRVSLNIFQELGDRIRIASVLHQIGMIHQARGEYDKALQQYHLSLNILQELGDRASIAASHHEIGRAYQNQGEYKKALEQYQTSLKIYDEFRNRLGVARTGMQVGQTYTLIGHHAEAFEWLGFALTTFAELKLPDAEISIAMLRDLRIKWEPENFDVAWRQATGEDVPEWLTQ